MRLCTPDVDSLVGDFTSSLLLDIDLTGTTDAASRAHAVQDAMRTAAAHASYPGLSVLRDLARHRSAPVLAPVVFTSALGLGELFGVDVTEAFGTPIWIISQGPQVSLDAQVTEFDGGVMVNWDVREDVFPAGVIDAMFAHHVDELRRLASAAARGLSLTRRLYRRNSVRCATRSTPDMPRPAEMRCTTASFGVPKLSRTRRPSCPAPVI